MKTLAETRRDTIELRYSVLSLWNPVNNFMSLRGLKS